MWAGRMARSVWEERREDRKINGRNELRPYLFVPAHPTINGRD